MCASSGCLSSASGVVAGAAAAGVDAVCARGDGTRTTGSQFSVYSLCCERRVAVAAIGFHNPHLRKA